MRVLHLWDSYAPDLFDHSFEICKEEGVDTRLLCMHYLGSDGPLPDGVQCIRRLGSAPSGKGLVAKASARLRTLWDRNRFRKKVNQAISDYRPNVIHIHYGTTAALLAGMDHVFDIPTIVSFYGYDISQGLQDKQIVKGYLQVMPLIALAHILCAEAGNRVAGLGCPKTRIVEANLPLNVDHYPDMGLCNEEVREWLIPARFVEKKGHKIALAAFAKMHAEFPNARLTCWGYGTPDTLINDIAAMGLAKYVRVIDNGRQVDFDTAYVEQLRNSDAILAPSITSSRGDDEGGPALTAVLAQVAGKPVIFSDFPGSECSVSDGVEGIIVPQGDVVALANAMLKLATNPALASEMGAAGRKRTSAEFSRTAYRDNVLGWYRQLSQ